jgi:two-component system, OmpR family, phosphate regulon sensor histidine kinase PhoR
LNAQLTIIKGVGRALVMQDITHLKQINKAKSDFVTAVSHDLRSPLTGILAYVELMQRVGTLNDAQREYAHQITRSIQSISLLITELLELGKIETGYDVDFEPVDLRAIVQETLDNLTHQLGEKGHTLDLECAPNLPLVHGNPLRLRQVTANLIGNAIKYTPENGRIRVEVCPEDGLAMFRVADNGIGIPIEDQPFVFDKFYRTERASKDYEGTGLGLAIVKSIVDQHNGRIWLESKEGQGTTFTVVLPITQA